MITLHNIALSGNCYKVRLFLALLNYPYQLHDIDLDKTEHKQPNYLALNPFGQAPVIEDNGVIIRDSQAILVYLARQYGDTHWYPDDPVILANIQAWLSTVANEIQHGPASLRLHVKLGRTIDITRSRQTCDNVLAIIEQHVKLYNWLAAEHVTIADIAMYPYLALAHEGRVDLRPYPAILAWLSRVESLAGFITMPGIQLQPH